MTVLKTNWVDGEHFPAAEANAIAAAVLALQVALGSVYTKPGTGIPSTDLSTAAQNLLAAAGTAVQPAALAAAINALINGAPGTADTLKEISDLLTADEGALAALTSVVASKAGLVQVAKNPDLLITGAVTVDGNDLVTSAAVIWPDSTAGTLTITSRDSNNAVLAYNITYGSPVTKTFTQPAITRNSNGVATNVPAIVVS